MNQKEEEQLDDLLEEKNVKEESFWSGESAKYISSSNVNWIKFFPETNEILINYKNSGKCYLQSSSRGEVEVFLRAPSKGSYAASVWRPRGYKLVSASYRPNTIT